MTKLVDSPRVVGLLLFLPTAAVLIIAGLLEPNPSGMGTHQQLGLSPCSFWTWFSIPCPMCGMTTTFTHMANVDIWNAIKTQPFGVVLFFGTVALMAVGFWDMVFGTGLHQRLFRWIFKYEPFFIRLLSCGFLMGWLYKLWITGIFAGG